MLAKEIVVGGEYKAKISGKIVNVRVDNIRDNGLRLKLGGRNTGSAFRYDVTNLATKRKTTFRSAAKFRGLANPPKPENKVLSPENEAKLRELNERGIVDCAGKADFFHDLKRIGFVELSSDTQLYGVTKRGMAWLQANLPKPVDIAVQHTPEGTNVIATDNKQIATAVKPAKKSKAKPVVVEETPAGKPVSVAHKLVKALEANDKELAQRLAACADKCAMHVKDVATLDRLLADFGLTKAQCTDGVIREAEKIDRELSLKVKERINRLTKPVATVPKQSAATTEAPAKPRRNNGETRTQVQIFGYSATAVIRWMGTKDWKPEDVAVALNTLGAGYISDTTIRIQLRAGKKGERGEPAPITPAQAKKLKEASM